MAIYEKHQKGCPANYAWDIPNVCNCISQKVKLHGVFYEHKNKVQISNKLVVKEVNWFGKAEDETNYGDVKAIREYEKKAWAERFVEKTNGLLQQKIPGSTHPATDKA